MNEQKQKNDPFVFRNYVRWPIIIAMLLVVACGITYIFIVDPSRPKSPTFPCVFHMMTGLYCPGCGNTRALHALVHGEIGQVFGYNFLFPFFVIILAWCYLVGLTKLIWKRRVMWMPKRIPTWCLLLSITLVILFTVLRNIPVWPFCLLAP